MMRNTYSGEESEAFDVNEELRSDELINVIDIIMNQKRYEPKRSITATCCKAQCSLSTLITFCPT